MKLELQDTAIDFVFVQNINEKAKGIQTQESPSFDEWKCGCATIASTSVQE